MQSSHPTSKDFRTRSIRFRDAVSSWRLPPRPRPGIPLRRGLCVPTPSTPTPAGSPPAMPRSRSRTGRCRSTTRVPQMCRIRRSSWWRWRSSVCTNTSRMSLGAFAVAPDYYFRTGEDLTKITEIPKLMPFVNKKPDAELFSDLDATVGWAKSQGGDTSRLGIIGFCRGGRTVWEYAAHNSGLKAGVAFYGSLVDPDTQKSIWPKNPIERAAEMKAPVLGLYGEADQGIPVSQVETLKTALQGAGKTFEIKIYPSAPHGFHADYRASYRKEAAEDAWSQMIAWLKKFQVLA